MSIGTTSVSIVVLNWNRPYDTTECLNSLLRSRNLEYDIVILDNASSDSSVNVIREFCHGISNDSGSSSFSKHLNFEFTFQEYVESSDSSEFELDGVVSEQALTPCVPVIQLLRACKNHGFAAGNNLAIKHILSFSNPKYIVLLNNDTVVHPDALSELIRAMDSNPNAAMAGPMIYFYGHSTDNPTISSAGGKLSLMRGESRNIRAGQGGSCQSMQSESVDYAEGSCLVVRTSFFVSYGLFDPDFISYWEDVDLCYRARESGSKVLMVPSARIWHKVHGSNVGARNIHFMTRNTFLMLAKHGSVLDILTFGVYFTVYSFWLRLGVHLIGHRSILEVKAFLRGVFDGLRWCICE